MLQHSAESRSPWRAPRQEPLVSIVIAHVSQQECSSVVSSFHWNGDAVRALRQELSQSISEELS
jgi:flavorubredoxin